MNENFYCSRRRPEEPPVQCDRCENQGVYEYTRPISGGGYTLESVHLCWGCTAKALSQLFQDVTEAQSEWNQFSRPDVVYVEPPRPPRDPNAKMLPMDVLEKIIREAVDVGIDDSFPEFDPIMAGVLR